MGVRSPIGSLTQNSKLITQNPSLLPPVYPITPDTLTSPELLAWADALFGAGCRLLQHRRKRMADAERFCELDALVSLAARHGAKVVVDDRPDLCLLTRAAGVHVGQEDLPPTEVRAFLGRGHWVGFSTHSLAQAETAFEEPLDYLAVGPVFPTESRENPSPVVSVEDQEAILAVSPFPVVAIGGITPERAGALWRRGFASVAVIGALAKDPVGGWEAFERVRREE